MSDAFKSWILPGGLPLQLGRTYSVVDTQRSTHMEETADEASTVPRAKRQKIQQACRWCRDRKTRCDGQRPVCAACERRGTSAYCVYEATLPAPSRSDISHLEQRVHQLERLPLSEHVISRAYSHTAAPGYETGSIDVGSSNTISASSQSQHQSRVDALATVDPEHDEGRLFGESSTIAFVREVAQSARTDHASPWSTRGDCAEVSSSLEPLDVSLQSSEDTAALPHRRKADDYLHCFWEFVHPLFPVLHRPTFAARYAQLWLPYNATTASRNVEETMFMPTLNLAFALGCQFSALVPPDQKAATANSFYERSRLVLLFDILGTTSDFVVRWLLLSGVYLQSTSHASHCWNSVGLGIRIAQSLGLHLERPGQCPESPMKREMKRRIWHTCVVLDRLLAMTFGRPAMIDAKSCNTPLPSLIDDEYLSMDVEALQPIHTPSRMGLLIYSCKLFDILADILESFYTININVMTGPMSYRENMIVQAVGFNSRLDQFLNDLPVYMKPVQGGNASAKNHYTNLQQQVLYCRYLYIRVLSLRPLILMLTKQATDDTVQASVSSLDDMVIKQSCALCVRTAHELIGTIHSHLDTSYRSSGWHAVYFAFASATILLAARRLHDPQLEALESFETSWQRSLSILRHYEKQIHSAPYALQVLETLRRQLLEQSDSDEPQRAYEERRLSYETPVQDGTITPQVPFDALAHWDFSHFNPYGADGLSDMSFGQHIALFGDNINTTQ